MLGNNKSLLALSLTKTAKQDIQRTPIAELGASELAVRNVAQNHRLAPQHWELTAATIELSTRDVGNIRDKHLRGKGRQGESFAVV